MKPKHQRLIFLAVSLCFLCVATVLALQALRDNVIYFYSPTELAEISPDAARRIRVGGLVEAGSVRHGQQNELQFRITDKRQAVEAEYQGMPPGLFREGQGVVAEGYLVEDGHFKVATLLTKHDEYYMPREVVDALKKSGRWQGKESSQ